MKFSAIRGLTSRRLAGGVTGGMGATAMVYSDDTPALIKLLAIASQVVYGARVQVCNGVADEVEINAAMGAIPGGGRVLLSEGTFVIADPIVVPVHGITLMGFDSSTIIDGDGLATTEHAIVINGMTDVTLRDFAIQTEDGGGKTCHCIFIANGSDRFEVSDVEVVASDSDGIYVEGTNIVDGRINKCTVHHCDGIGISVGMDAANSALRFHIWDCFVHDNGTDGINFGGPGSSQYCIIEGNTAYLNTQVGIWATLFDDGTIDGNLLIANGQWGIRLTNSDHTTVEDNGCHINESDNIMLEVATNSLVIGNTCFGAVAEDTSDGIQVDAGSVDCQVIGNHCGENARHGLHLLGARTVAEGNFVHENEHHGICCRAAELLINGNYVYDNGQDAAGTYHGIDLSTLADRSSIVGNWIGGVVDNGEVQEDGIHVGDGATDLIISNNYCHNGMGDGICLVANNDNCVLNGNRCTANDDIGINNVAASSDKCIITCNQLLGNTGANLVDAGTGTMVAHNITA